MRLRVKFRKYGPVRYIGHLDIMRYFQKAIRRAGIDIAYTTGYSPHQIMSFAAPLGVGLESNGEYMDIEVNSVTDSQDMLERLERAGVPGVEVVSVKVLPETAGNAMASVAAAEYTVRFRQDQQPAFDYEKELASFMEKEHILVTKETKKGTRQMDIKPGIYKLWVSDSAICMLVDASSGGNIKPSLLIEAYLVEHGEALKENALMITREETYTNVGSAEKPELVSLDDLGAEIAR